MVNYRIAVFLIIFALSAGLANAQINATGGTITTSGVYVIHTFTSTANFTVSSGTQNVTILVVGGGGGGGGSISGGGGGGGVIYNTSVALSAQTYNITVGAGGTNGSGARQGSNGSDSKFGTLLTAYGGGGGGVYGGTKNGKLGGSGGGGSADDTASGTGGAAVSGQGNIGGNGKNGTNPWSGAGGGGANGTGGHGGTNGGTGGAGSGYGISGTLTYYAGGGGGGHYDGSGSGTGGTGGTGGGGNGTEGNPGNMGLNGTANTGGGGGGAGNAGSGGIGGSGIVIISYDNSSYANITDSVTGLVGTGYNGAAISAGILTTDAVNDYVNTGVAENYSSSFSWSVWVKKNTTVNCQDGANIIGRDYDWRLFTGGACEIILNVQNTSNQDETHYNASLAFGNSTWVYVVAVFDLSNNRSYLYVNNILRSNHTQKGVEQLANTKGLKLGGDPVTGLYFNGSIANLTIFNATLDSANRTYLMANNTPYCDNLAHWWAFNSTPPSCIANSTAVTYDLYVNITVSNTTIRTIPSNFRGAHTAETLQNPAYSSGLRDHAADLAVVNTTKIMAYRKDYDLANFCPTYTGNASAPCSFTTTYGSNYNITSVKNMVSEAASMGIKVHFVDDGATDWGADNSSKCTYGSNAPDFNYTSCDWANNTIHANAIIQFLNAVDCDVYNGTCVHEGRNEAYLASGTILGAAAGTFYYRNNTVTCAQRVTGQMVEWNQTTPLIRAAFNDTIEYWSGAMNYGYHPCGENMSNQFMAEHPYGGNNSPDFMNDHEYSSGNPPVLNEDLALAEAAFTAGGYGGKWGITESGLNSNSLNWNSQGYQQAKLMEFLIYYAVNTTGQRILFFQFDGDESYTIYNSTNTTVRYPGKVLNASKYFDETTGTLRTCTTTNVNVTCAYSLQNNTKGVLILSNTNNQTMLIQQISISGYNISAASSNFNGTSATVSGNNIVNLSIGKLGIDGLNTTLSGVDSLPPTILNRTEWTNSSNLQVNITASESSNASINYGTNYTILGTKVNVTGFGTVISFNISGLTSNTNHHYNITLCDSLGNCGTYGIYSEWTYNASIYFTTTTPSTSTPSIVEPNNQNFSYIISNYDNLTTRSTWRLNGTNITSCYGYTSCNFTGNYTSSGTYVYNVSVETDVARVNNISYQWTLTVNDTATTYTYITAKDLYDNASINNFTMVIGNNFSCYQETANVSTSCGGVSTGSYGFDAFYFNINYTKPYGASGAMWQTNLGSTLFAPTTNVTLPDACYDADSTKIILRISSNKTNYSSNAECFNGVDYQIVKTFSYVIAHSIIVEGTERLWDGNYLLSAFYNGTTWGYGGSAGGAYIGEESIYWNITDVVGAGSYSTTNGSIVLNSTQIDFSASYALNFSSNNYMNRTYEAQNIGANFTAFLYSGVAQFLAYNQTNASVTGFNITLNGATYASTNTSIFIPSTAFNATFSKTGYANVTTEYSAGALYNGTLNFSVTETVFSLVFNDPGLLLENETYNLTANVSSNVAGNWLVEWFRNGASVFSEYVAQVGVSTWQWVVGYEDSGDYNITVNGTFNSSGVYNGTIETESLIVTVEDTYPAPLTPLGIEPNGGSYEYSIPLLCHVDYVPIAPYHYEYVYSINGSNYTAMNVNYSKPFQQFDISSDAYGSNYTFGCRVYSVSGISNYTYSNTFAKVNKNNFYMFYPQGQTSYQAMVPYTLGYVMEAENSIGATIYAGFVDCTGSGLWDYTFRYSTTNETTVRETFSCLNARGKVQTTIGMVLFKNNTNSWEGIGCKGLEYTENYCAVYKTYEVNVQ